MAPLPSPFLSQLNNEPVLAYRLQYQRFRLGDSKGAHGEEPEAAPSAAAGMSGGDVDDDEWDMDEEDKEIFQEIASYRIDYRAHRCGAHHGAKGEVTNLAHKMGMRHVMMLPVSQLVSLARFRAAAMLESVKSSFHVHLGAGKLGLGLVVPAIHASQGTPYAILQRSSSSWAPLLKSVGGSDGANDPSNASNAPSNGNNAPSNGSNGKGHGHTVELRINGKPVAAGLTLVRTADDILEAAGDADGGCPRMFACTDDPKTLKTLVGRAQTLSIALGPVMGEVVLPLLEDLPHKPTGERPCLYACENDHKAVDALEKALEGRCDVVNCMVDRICAGRKVGEGYIDVEAEPYLGEIVVIAPPANVPLPPFAGEGIRVPRLKAEAEYFCQRKIIMVNGMHTTLAFLTLLEKEPGSLDGDGWKDHLLLPPEQTSAEVQRQIWLWAVARLLYVFWEHEPAIVKQAHGVDTDEAACDELLKYAKATLARYGTVKDKCGRVLGGGVATRWQGRLKMIESFLDGEPAMHGGIRLKLLQRSGVEEGELRAAVSKLVYEARRFVGVTVKKTSHISG